MAIPKSIGSVKRFGVRYGRTSRHNVGAIEREQRKSHLCPYCRKVKVKRASAGIWKCRSCGVKFTGKAYSVSHQGRSLARETKDNQAEAIEEITKDTEEGAKYKEAKQEREDIQPEMEEEEKEE